MHIPRSSIFGGAVILLLLTGVLGLGPIRPGPVAQGMTSPSATGLGLPVVPKAAAATARPAPTSRPAPPSATAKPVVRPAPTPASAPITSAVVFGHYYYGIGPEADQALADQLTHDARVKILTSWFNGTDDFSWITSWQGSTVANWWSRSYVLHVVIYDNAANDPTCSCRRWPISAQYLQDMQRLAQIFAGPNDGAHIVLFSLDTEFQTYIQPNNEYNATTAWYYDQLQSNLVAARSRIKAVAPNALVSFSWGGWQTRWDDPAKGGGVSMVPHFAATMRQMDFMSFQAMQSDTNVNDILKNVRVFGSYNRHLMVAHYLPDNQSQTTYNSDIGRFFTPSFVNETRSGGLFAFSFMSSTNMNPGWPLNTCVGGVNRFTQ